MLRMSNFFEEEGCEPNCQHICVIDVDGQRGMTYITNKN